MKNLKISVLLMLMLLAMSGCLSPNEERVEDLEEGSFSIYLLAQQVSAAQLSGIELETLELEDEPILSDDDIVTYWKETHEIELTVSAYERIGQLKVPTTGLPFVVCIGREPIYSGAFWTIISSHSFDGIIILVPLMMKEHSIQITPGYPGTSHFKGQDLRADPRILKSLEQTGKLK